MSVIKLFYLQSNVVTSNIKVIRKMGSSVFPKTKLNYCGAFQCFFRRLACKNLISKFQLTIIIGVLLYLFICSSKNSFSVTIEPAQSNSTGLANVPEKLLQPKVLCYILLSQSKLQAARIIQNTWGQKCDRLIFYGNFKNSPDNVNVTHISSKEGYAYLWSKTKEALRHLYEEYHHKFEWFLKADDDTFVIMENLRHFVADQDSNKSLWAGFKLRSSKMRHGYMSGGAGYLFSKEALKQVVKILGRSQPSLPSQLGNSNDNKIANTQNCDIYGNIGYEDVELGKCFRDAGVNEIVSMDSHGQQRFLPLPLRTFLNNAISSFHWLRHQSWNAIKFGKRCCSKQLITMHNVPPDEMITLYFLIYNITL